jgi:hypothetical protein
MQRLFLPTGDPAAEDRHFAHRWMTEYHGFDFAGVHVFATSDDHVFQPIEDLNVSGSVLITDVSRPKEPVSENRRRCNFIVLITRHHVGPAYHQVTRP